MAIIPKLCAGFRRSSPQEDAITTIAVETPAGDRKTDAAAQDGPAEEPEKPFELPTEDAQKGVQTIEAVTLTWSKPSLIAVFILYVTTATAAAAAAASS